MVNVNKEGIMSELNEIAAALSKLQGEVLNATKDKQGYNYNYADLAQVLDIARPLMAKHGLSLTQLPTTQTTGHIGLTSILMHSSGQSISSFFELPIEGQKVVAQSAGSVITYMRRYSLAAILGIAQDDNDADTQLINRAKSSINEDELKEAIKAIQSCTTMEELKNVFASLDPKIRTKANEEKNAKKKELENAQQ